MADIEAVIFDWAGTTVDFGCFAPVQAFLEAFRSVGIEPILDEVRKPMGMLKRDHVKTMMSMNRIRSLWNQEHGRDWTEADVDLVYERSEKGILNILHDFTAPKPFVMQTCEYLREKGIRIGSTTGYTDEMMDIVVAGAKELGYQPDAWYSPNAVHNMGRPYPYMIYKNMEALKVSSVHNVIKIGDTASDIREGKNAGVLSIGVVDGSSVMGLTEEECGALSKEAYLEVYHKVSKVYWEAGANYVIGSLRELPDLMNSLK